MKGSLKKQFTEELKTFEQGRFQVFCKDFLPLIDPLYTSLEMHGGTADGKTRKGTPDLIRTLNDGKQIAAQCSVEVNYWRMPKDKDKLSQWKPCKDIDKCLQEIDNPIEIILCSSQEIPTTSQNAKAEIINYAQNKTKVKITPLSCTDISEVLIKNVENLECTNIFKSYFPESYRLFDQLREAQKYQLAGEIYKEKPVVPFDKIFDIATEAIQKYGDLEEAKHYVLNKISEFKSRFEREYPLQPGHVTRTIKDDSSLRNPIGIRQVVLGVPKIGKTFLIAQYAVGWQSNNWLLHWFDCTIEEHESKSFLEDVLKNVWACFLPPDKASELASGIIRLNDVSLSTLKYNFDHPCIYVLDNAECLPPATVESFCDTLALLRHHNLLSQIGIIFISNKGLKHQCPAISKEFISPPWPKEELKQLLDAKFPEADHFQNESYLSLLETMSAGHPLIAIALARKFSSPKDLLLSNLQAPSPADEDLSSEVKNFLFNDILKDDNSRNLVLRLSTLIYRANDRIINAIMKKINPVIGKPFNLILEELYGSVLEGDEKLGYGVSYIYKEVAKRQFSSLEKDELYNVVRQELLKPEGNRLNASDICEGIFYSILAKDFKTAFLWAIILLKSAVLDSRLPKTQIKNILSQLDYLPYIQVSDDPKLVFSYNSVLLIMALAYSGIEEHEKAVKILENAKPSPSTSEDDELKEVFNSLYATLNLYRMIQLAFTNPSESMKVLPEVDFNKLIKFSSDNHSLISNFFKDLILVLPFKDISKIALKEMVNFIDCTQGKEVANLIVLAIHIGEKASREEMKIDELRKMVTLDTSLDDILYSAVLTQYTLQKNQLEESLDYQKRLLLLCKDNNLLFSEVEATLQLVQGDTYYRMNQDEEAGSAYLRSLESSYKDSFEYAWANYRLGLLAMELKDAEQYFRQASKTFDLLQFEDQCTRSEGERGIVLIQLGRPLEFVRIVEWMCRRYYLRNRSNVAPACTMALSQLVRLKFELMEEEIPEGQGEIYPKFERGGYQRILDTAKPKVGGVVAFLSLSNVYSLLKEKNRKVRCLRIALRFNDTNQKDKNANALVILDFLRELIPNGNKTEITRVMMQGIFQEDFQIVVSSDEILPQNLKGFQENPDKFLSFCVFRPLDEKYTTFNDSQAQQFMNVLSNIESSLQTEGHKKLGWWLAEVYLRKANLAEKYLEKNERYKFWKLAYDYGLQNQNYNVLFWSAHALGFVYPEYSMSIGELSEIQINTIQAISLLGGDYEQLITVGKNLFNFWRKIGWRRLSEHDLKVKQKLLDGAKALASIGFNKDDAGPIMLLLLSSAYDFHGTCLDWAIEKAVSQKQRIPPQVLENILPYIDFKA